MAWLLRLFRMYRQDLDRTHDSINSMDKEPPTGIDTVDKPYTFKIYQGSARGGGAQYADAVVLY